MQMAVIIGDVLLIFKERNTVMFWAKYYMYVHQSEQLEISVQGTCTVQGTCKEEFVCRTF